MVITRIIGTRRPATHEVQDIHVEHPDCLITAVTQQIPPEHLVAWEKALRWTPKMRGWLQSFEEALHDVTIGRRPLLYGWRHELMMTAKNLIFNDLGWVSVCCMSDHLDMALAMKWSHAQPLEIQHVANGILLGYPPAEVEEWVKSGCPGPTLREVLRTKPSAQ